MAKDNRKPSPKYEAIAQRVIETRSELQYIKNSSVKIIYLESSHSKRKKGGYVYADCMLVPDKYKWCCPWDFVITVYEPNVMHMNMQQLEILLFHELLHVGIERNGFGDESFRMVPHDLEEFKTVIEQFGINWAEGGTE